jgi:hypothetical protein
MVLGEVAMKNPMEEVEEGVRHIQNHIHWWDAMKGTTQEELVKTLECIQADATKIAEHVQQWLIEIHS